MLNVKPGARCNSWCNAYCHSDRITSPQLLQRLNCQELQEWMPLSTSGRKIQFPALWRTESCQWNCTASPYHVNNRSVNTPTGVHEEHLRYTLKSQESIMRPSFEIPRGYQLQAVDICYRTVLTSTHCFQCLGCSVLSGRSAWLSKGFLQTELRTAADATHRKKGKCSRA